MVMTGKNHVIMLNVYKALMGLNNVAIKQLYGIELQHVFPVKLHVL